MTVGLDAAYNFNMMTKNSFHWKTFLASLCYFETAYAGIGLYLTAILFSLSKAIQGIEVTEGEINIIKIEGIIMGTLYIFYHICVQ